MEDQEIYSVKKSSIIKIEDHSLFKKYSNTIASQIFIDDLKLLIDLFFKKAGINMGKESYDSSDASIGAITEFIYKDYSTIPLNFIASAFVRGSLGKYGPGRLVPNMVYKWIHETALEYDKMESHKKIMSSSYANSMDLHKYPVGKAIMKKIDWLTSGLIDEDGWDQILLKALAERIKQGLDCYPEVFGLKSLKPHNP
jgi:hypothetical protein